MGCSFTTVPPTTIKVVIPDELKVPCKPAKIKSQDMGGLLQVAIENAQIINDCERRKKAIIDLVN